MKCKSLSFLMLLWSGASVAAGLPGPAAESPIPNQNGLAPRYLTEFQHIGQGFSWSAHIDTELFANLAGGIRQGTANTTAGQLGLQWDSGKAGAWRGGLFTTSVFGIYSSAEDTAYSGDLQTASNIYAPSAVRLYEANCYVFRYFRISEASYPAVRWRDYGKQFLDKLGRIGG